MNEVVMAILTALPPTLMATAALWKVIKVHKELNSRLTEWKEETARATVASNAAAKAEGIKEGKEIKP
jgi:hypothetical protein